MQGHAGAHDGLDSVATGRRVPQQVGTQRGGAQRGGGGDDDGGRWRQVRARMRAAQLAEQLRHHVMHLGWKP